tara:strand:- start:584 stop:1327 length:744 start_codon:yes stop_codon:yes gene_type:complete
MDSGRAGIDIADANKLLPFNPNERVVGISYINGNSLDINNLPYISDTPISFPLDVMYLNINNNNEFITEEEEVKLSYNLEYLPEHITISITNNISGEIFNIADVNEITFTTVEKGSFLFLGNEGVSSYPQLGSSHFTINIIYNELIINEQENLIPIQYALHQNYPNPFNPITTISYDLPEHSYVTIIIYDMMGREITRLVDQNQNSGFKSVLWNATDKYGREVSAGLYLYKIQTGEYIDTKKMILLK